MLSFRMTVHTLLLVSTSGGKHLQMPPRHTRIHAVAFLGILLQLYIACVQSYDAAEGEALGRKYETLNWRIISKPGGATVKPDEFYSLYG